MFNWKNNSLFFYIINLTLIIWLIFNGSKVGTLGLYLIGLTAYLNAICVLVSVNSIKTNMNLFLIFIFSLHIILCGIFITNSILVFYILFEASLIPMFLLVIGWGSRLERSRAAYYLFFYTFISSILMLLSVVKLYILTGTLNIEVISFTNIPIFYQKWGMICMFIAFSVKIPMIPFHIWLPQAHVEAPLAGSILLAGIMLKLGAFGFIRLALPIYPHSFYYYSPIFLFLSLLSILYGGLSTIRQSDMKRLIAYSSVAHMGFATYALFNPLNVEMGLVGCILILIAHGFASPALFSVVGFLYERYHTRVIKYYSGVGQIMPILGVYAFLFTLCSIAFPGSLNFVGEFIIVILASQYAYSHGFMMFIGCLVGLIYALYFYQRIFTGSLSIYLRKGKDLTREEFLTLLLLFIPVLGLGIYPNPLITALF